MKKALVATSVASMVDQFLLPSVFLLKDLGYEVHILCNFNDGNTCSDEQIKKLQATLNDNGIKYFQVDFARNVAKVTKNLSAYKQVQAIIKNNHYNLVHCHSPIGGLVMRLACRKTRKNGTKVIYTAHGFHFYKGAPLKNWLIYYPVEKICSYFTDVLITINSEDYNFAKKKMKAKQIQYVSGVGINLNNFADILVKKDDKRKELAVPKNAKLLISVGELNNNKNHETVIRAISDIENVYYVIAGKGALQEHLQNVINQLNMANRVKLLGFRDDISELCNTADIFVMPSFREGLSVALMEAMACGLPCVVSRIRGNVDLIDENGGVLFNPNDIIDCKNSIEKISLKDFSKLGAYNFEKIKQFSLESVDLKLKDIYLNCIQK